MVFFNYATMQMAAKIVYYGPGLCGKTTNLHHIYAKTSPQSRGEMVSLETETDRTLFFDLLPIDVGVIGGFKTRLQLYTIPGQVFYNTTRKLVLKGVDGVVFVADSQVAALSGNVDSIKNLRENLAEIGLNLDDIPLVLQLNKRDLPNVASVEELLDAIDPLRSYEYVESVASTGVGVFETLKVISKLTLRTLRRRMTGEEPAKGGPRKLGDVAQFRVKNDAAPREAQPAPAAPAAPKVVTAPIQAMPNPPAAAAAASVAAQAAPQTQAHTQTAVEDEIDMRVDRTSTEPEPAPATEPEIEFPEADKPAKAAPVKHVKVRSTIDVMAELEALRKRATAQTTPRSKKDAATAAKSGPGRELQKALTVHVPPLVLPQTKRLKVTLSFENTDGGVVQEQQQTLELEDTSDVESVSVNLRIDQI
jgi:signal recognition particle receptor subunit beta